MTGVMLFFTNGPCKQTIPMCLHRVNRYTDPMKGLNIRVNVQDHGNHLQFSIGIRDHCIGGMPSNIVLMLRNELGTTKVIDDRTTKSDDCGTAASKGRSSNTGFPHLVQLYHVLTDAGRDFDIHFNFFGDGTSVQIRFTMAVISPMSVEIRPGLASASDSSPRALHHGKNGYMVMTYMIAHNHNKGMALIDFCVVVCTYMFTFHNIECIFILPRYNIGC